jgi:hypothetical protein
METWDEKAVGVAVQIGKDFSRSGEVTGSQDGEMNVLLKPSTA